MRRGLRLHNYSITPLHNRRRQQSGYMLIVLMVMVALASLALLAIYPDMKQQIRRDQEEEMCHRGTQYMRAIQHFYKKFGRYPTRIEELEDTNHLRFLRKRYKDPLAHDQQGKEKDFKLLHMQDVNLGGSSMLGGMPGGMMPGGGGFGGGQQSFANNGPGGLAGGASGPMVQAGLNAMQQQGGAAASVQANSGDDESEGSPNPNPQGTPNPSGGPGFNTGQTTGTGLNNTVFGGGPILGVASTNKSDKTIREYNKKNHYNDWMFIYDPTSDRGGLLVGPWQIPNTQTLTGATPAGQLTPGAQQPQGLGTPFGQQSSGFGSPQPQPQQQPQNSPQEQ